jgi:hypothetical protein
MISEVPLKQLNAIFRDMKKSNTVSSEVLIRIQFYFQIEDSELRVFMINSLFCIYL